MSDKELRSHCQLCWRPVRRGFACDGRAATGGGEYNHWHWLLGRPRALDNCRSLLYDPIIHALYDDGQRPPLYQEYLAWLEKGGGGYFGKRELKEARKHLRTKAD